MVCYFGFLFSFSSSFSLLKIEIQNKKANHKGKEEKGRRDRKTTTKCQLNCILCFSISSYLSSCPSISFGLAQRALGSYFSRIGFSTERRPMKSIYEPSAQRAAKANDMLLTPSTPAHDILAKLYFANLNREYIFSGQVQG